ncbi:hypothetical protein [Streptomyces sp. AC627_RSS907]|uniref:hypothetical protein n=1 Tax=Streptomyces sp. AC627_RSS907 TaxID=2823684 RepID=UPI001C24FD8B|nr:hypothetical protein [Streptomyces sp. AC627_RSS907]
MLDGELGAVDRSQGAETDRGVRGEGCRHSLGVSLKACVWIVEVGESGGFQPPDLQAVVGPGAVVVVGRDLAPGQAADAGGQTGMVGLDLGLPYSSRYVP